MKNFKLSNLSKKIIGAGVIGLILLIIVAAIGNPLIDTVERAIYQISGNSYKNTNYLELKGYGGDYGIYEEMAVYDSASSMDGGSYSKEILPPPVGSGTQGDTAEDFEVTEYSVYIESRKIKNDCQAITSLKELDYVIFEDATEHEKGCYFTFKVKVENMEEVLDAIKALDPKDLTKTTYTIQRSIEYILNEREVLEKKKQAIEETLEEALKAYDEISRFATQNRDATALANVIEGKIKTIERLSMERININERLNRLTQSEAKQMDQLEYTYFYVSVAEDKFIDKDGLKESWKNRLKEMIQDINGTIQGLSIGLITLLLFAIQYGLYLLILIVIAKLFWTLTKNIWRK
jgi:hypothetical protein